MSQPTALVPVADGSEEIEVVCIIDTLRRAGITVTVAAVGAERAVTCSRGVVLTADVLLTDTAGQTYDLIALPGGLPGAEHLRDSETLAALLLAQDARGGLIGAICAAPAVVLEPLGLLAGRVATCHPSVAAQLTSGRRNDDRVVVDGHIVTSGGPGTAIEFALALIGELLGPEQRATVSAPMLIRE